MTRELRKAGPGRALRRLYAQRSIRDRILAYLRRARRADRAQGDDGFRSTADILTFIKARDAIIRHALHSLVQLGAIECDTSHQPYDWRIRYPHAASRRPPATSSPRGSTHPTGEG